MDKTFSNLRRLNLVAGLFHLVQGVLIIWLSKDFLLPITTSFLKLDQATQSLQPSLQQLTEVNFAPFIALFSFFSAAAHFAVSSPGLFQKYTANLQKGINQARWLEYSFSASLMIVLIAMLTGMYDLGSIILMFALNATMIWFGWMMELHNQTTQKTDWTSFVFGCLAGIVPWIVIALYLFGSGEGDAKPPDFVYWIFFSIFLFFNTFAINQYLQYKKVGKWKEYLFGEKAYIILSFIAKSALAWQVFGGTLRP